MTTPLTIVKPTGSPKGGIVVMQEAFGVNAHIVDVCNRLAASGYVAVAPHLFHRTGDPRLGYEDRSAIWSHIEALTMDNVLEDLDAALDALGAEGIEPARRATVGFCLGGTVSFFSAIHRRIGAAVTFYGGGITGRWCFPSQIEQAPDLAAPWLGLYGDKDGGIPIDDVEALRAAAATSEVSTEIVRYPDADHGFNCNDRSSYDADAAADAWKRMLAWFGHFLPAE